MMLSLSRNYFSSLLVLLSVVFLSQPVVVAAENTHNLQDGIDQTAHDTADQVGLSTLKINDVILNILNYALGLLGIVAMTVIIYAGGLYITSAGNEEKAHLAKRAITYAVIGILLVGLSAVIVNTVITQAIN